MSVYGVKLKNLSSFLLGVKSGVSFNAKGMVISHHVCCLDGTNNGYQHIAGLISNQHLANKVNLQNVAKNHKIYINKSLMFC